MADTHSIFRYLNFLYVVPLHILTFTHAFRLRLHYSTFSYTDEADCCKLRCISSIGAIKIDELQSKYRMLCQKDKDNPLTMAYGNTSKSGSRLDRLYVYGHFFCAKAYQLVFKVPKTRYISIKCNNNLILLKISIKA